MATSTEAGKGEAKKPAAKRGSAREENGGIAANADGVKFEVKNGNYVIKFDYNPAMVAAIRSVEGAKLDRDELAWVVPIGDPPRLTELKPVIENMRKEFIADREDKAEIVALAKAAAEKLQRDNGTVAGVAPMVSDYVVNSGEHAGTIIALNGRYAAQFTGFGKENGAAFVSLHSLPRIRDQVFKGDRVAIDYNQGTPGSVTHIRTREERAAEFNESLGKNVDGVRVVEQDGKFHVEFDYNPALSERISRIDGANFDRDAKVWTVGTDKKTFLVNAVNDMRREVVADQRDRTALEQVARDKIDGAVIKEAFTKDDAFSTGKVLAQNSRYVLQHTGKEYVALHRQSAFSRSQQVETGKSYRIEYKGGKAQVSERGLSKSHGNER